MILGRLLNRLPRVTQQLLTFERRLAELRLHQKEEDGAVPEDSVSPPQVTVGRRSHLRSHLQEACAGQGVANQVRRPVQPAPSL